jgi:hypothetical protein
VLGLVGHPTPRGASGGAESEPTNAASCAAWVKERALLESLDLDETSYEAVVGNS